MLENVSFEINKGEICGFTGRNGTGKTMLFKILSGLCLPTSGCVTYCGEVISEGGKFISSVGVMIETPGFIPHYSGLKNLLILNGLSLDRTDKKHIRSLMEMMGLDPDNRKGIKTYSLGMRQKLGFISAVMNYPGLLILDEPMNSLDSESTVIIRDYLIKLNREKNTTILITSHISEDISSLCGRVFCISDNTVTEIKPEVNSDE